MLVVVGVVVVDAKDVMRLESARRRKGSRRGKVEVSRAARVSVFWLGCRLGEFGAFVLSVDALKRHEERLPGL